MFGNQPLRASSSTTKIISSRVPLPSQQICRGVIAPGVLKLPKQIDQRKRNSETINASAGSRTSGNVIY